MPHATAADIEYSVERYLNQRAVRSNWLVGMGVILHPDFTVNVTQSRSGVYRVVITGEDSECDFSCECSDVIVSKYRPHITFVLEQQSQPPQVRKLVPLQPARQKLLSLVRADSSLSTNDFYRLSAVDGNTQVNARRRWGELRTEYGFDTTYDGGSFYRGSEHPISEPNPRPNMSQLDSDHRAMISARDMWKCNKCGTPIQTEIGSDGQPGLLDHRRPIPYGGTDDPQNLQLFCNRFHKFVFKEIKVNGRNLLETYQS
jgi:hypothetical protein